MIKVLKQDSESYKKTELLNEFLSSNGIELHLTVYKGIIYKTNDNYFRHSSEGDNTDIIPPYYGGRYILCDKNGNTDFYN